MPTPTDHPRESGRRAPGRMWLAALLCLAGKGLLGAPLPDTRAVLEHLPVRVPPVESKIAAKTPSKTPSRTMAKAAARSQAKSGTKPHRPSHPQPHHWPGEGDPAVERVRRCILKRESRGNYHVVDPSGRWFGGYQFAMITSNTAAMRMKRQDLVGVPANLWSKEDQDAAFYVIYDRGRGRKHWRKGRYDCS